MRLVTVLRGLAGSWGADVLQGCMEAPGGTLTPVGISWAQADTSQSLLMDRF